MTLEVSSTRTRPERSRPVLASPRHAGAAWRRLILICALLVLGSGGCALQCRDRARRARAGQKRGGGAFPGAALKSGDGRAASSSGKAQKGTAIAPALGEPPRLRASGAAPSFVYAAAGLVEAAFFGMELVWYRMLAPLLDGSVYTFGLVLAVALLGIGAGGLAYAVGRHQRQATLSGFALPCAALEAMFIMLPYALGDRVALLALGVRPAGSFCAVASSDEDRVRSTAPRRLFMR